MTTAFDYTAAETTCRGAIALPAGDAKVPGIAIFADIGGVGDHTKKWADRIASELGYVALAADVYGEGRTPVDFTEGLKWIHEFRADPPKLVARAAAALDALKAHPRCDGRIGAIGFCFGGGTVLEIARAAHPLMSTGVSFHGALDTTTAVPPGSIHAKLMVAHGAEDPMANYAVLTAFLAEMAVAAADCQTIAYTGVVHSFTNESADGSFMAGIKYNASAARRSYNAMAAHFAEVFA
jgi:dienelactone hydrolase